MRVSRIKIILLTVVTIITCTPPVVFAKVLVDPRPELPVTSINITFRVGSADDPVSKKGLAYATAMLMREGGVRAWKKLKPKSRAEIEDTLFPLGADVDVSINKEQVSLSTIVTADNALNVLELTAQMILVPMWDEKEWQRIKAETLDHLSKRWPQEDQEDLGKAALDYWMYGKSHPYAHVVEGRVHDVKNISIDDIKAFHRKLFTRKRMVIGLSGRIDKRLRQLARDLNGALAIGSSGKVRLPAARDTEGVVATGPHRLLIVHGPFEATGVHVGFPIVVTRASSDFAAMLLMSAAFGRHRSFVGRLMRVVRELRGLNYGTYAYVEDFPEGGHHLEEQTQVARSQQAFTVWGRPTPPENGCFLMRQILREMNSLVENGLTNEEFTLTKGFLIGSIPLTALGISRSLGYQIDSEFYAIKGNYLGQLTKQINKLSRSDVNAVIRKHLRSSGLNIVLVTSDAQKLKRELQSEKCEVHYPPGVTKPSEITNEDSLIAGFKVFFDESATTIMPASELF